MYNLPNILTISRIVVIPVIFLSIYINWTSWSILAAVLYTVAAITDYFDGYLARARNQVSILGKLLDPIADKLLVIAALLIIVVKGMISPISYVPVVIILCREVLVSGLREFLAQMKVEMPVTNLAKWKTTAQMFAIGLILYSAIPVFAWTQPVGEILIWVAGILTSITGYTYLSESLSYVKTAHDKEETAKKNKVEIVVKEVSKKVVAVKKKVPAKKVVAVKKKAPVKKASAEKTTTAKKTATKTSAKKTVTKTKKATKTTAAKKTIKNNSGLE